MTQKEYTPKFTSAKEVGLSQDVGNGTTSMMQSFAQFNEPAQPEKNAAEKTADELENTPQGATGAIRTKKDSILNQARQIYNTQLNNNQA